MHSDVTPRICHNPAILAPQPGRKILLSGKELCVSEFGCSVADWRQPRRGPRAMNVEINTGSRGPSHAASFRFRVRACPSRRHRGRGGSSAAHEPAAGADVRRRRRSPITGRASMSARMAAGASAPAPSTTASSSAARSASTRSGTTSCSARKATAASSIGAERTRSARRGFAAASPSTASSSTAPAASAFQDFNDVGWVAGGGGEYALTDNVSVGVEYLHYDFGSDDSDVVRGRVNVKFNSLFGG